MLTSFPHLDTPTDMMMIEINFCIGCTFHSACLFSFSFFFFFFFFFFLFTWHWSIHFIFLQFCSLTLASLFDRPFDSRGRRVQTAAPTTWPRSTSSALFRSSRPLRVHSTNSAPAADAHCDYIVITSPLHFCRPSQPKRRRHPDAEHKNPAISGIRAPPRRQIASAFPVRNGCDPSTSGDRSHLFIASRVFSGFPDLADRRTDVTLPESVKCLTPPGPAGRPIVFQRQPAAIKQRPHSRPTTTATTVAAQSAGSALNGRHR